MSGSPSREKDLEKFFKILHKGFWQLILATCSQVIWVVKNACFAQIRLNLRQFLKKLFSFPRITCKPLCLFRLSLSQNCHFHSQKLHFSLQSFLNLQEKVWVFNFFHSISSLKPSFSWICCLYWDMDIWLMNMGFWCFCWVWYMGFVEFHSIMLVLHVYTTCLCILL